MVATVVTNTQPQFAAFLSQKPYYTYDTTDYGDKDPLAPRNHYQLFRSVPGRVPAAQGVSFFAFNYAARDHWDTAYEQVADDQVTVLPSRNGPVATRTWEAIRAGIQAGNLAQMVKERSNGSSATATLVASGSVRELLDWLDTH
jgi:hypothetical protein